MRRPFATSNGGAKGDVRFMFQAIVTRLHSPRTQSNPRSKNCRKPSTDLIMPNTGSGSCCATRKASCPLPFSAGAPWIEPVWDPAVRSELQRNAQPMTGGWTRPVAVSGTMFAASQAMTFAALKYPLSAPAGFRPGQVVRQSLELPIIGSSCCLSLAAAPHRSATTSRLLRRHHRPGVVALIEPTARHWHDA